MIGNRMDPDLICNKIGHEQQIIVEICTCYHCENQRPCCLKCTFNDHADHKERVKKLNCLKKHFSLRPDFTWLQDFGNRLVMMLNEVQQILMALFPVYPTEVSLTNLSQFGEQVSQWNELFYDEVRVNVENSFKLFEQNLRNLFDPIYKEGQVWNQRRQQEAKRLREQGKKLRLNGKYREAIEIYDRILQINSDDDDSFNNKGVSLSKVDRLDEALYNYNQAILINPNNYTFLRNKAACLNNLKRYKEALECANRAIEINPNYAPSWNSKGVALENLNFIEQALECYKIAVKIQPNDARLFNLADNLEKLGQKEEALKYTRQLIQINPDFEKSYQILSRLEQ